MTLSVWKRPRLGTGEVVFFFLRRTAVGKQRRSRREPSCRPQRSEVLSRRLWRRPWTAAADPPPAAWTPAGGGRAGSAPSAGSPRAADRSAVPAGRSVAAGESADGASRSDRQDADSGRPNGGRVFYPAGVRSSAAFAKQLPSTKLGCP